MYGSQLYVSRRALGSLGGRNIIGQGADCPWTVRVLSLFPVRPWTKQTSTVASGKSCHSRTPSGNDRTSFEVLRRGLDGLILGVDRWLGLDEHRRRFVPWSLADASETV